jgi:hypothetical protein
MAKANLGSFSGVSAFCSVILWHEKDTLLPLLAAIAFFPAGAVYP